MPRSEHSPDHDQAPVVLCVAGFDPSGGAGVQADIETLSALQTRAVCALTANTVQDGGGLLRVVPVDAETLVAQIRLLVANFDIRAVKIGMLATPENVDAVHQALDAPGVDIVLDPVWRAGAHEGDGGDPGKGALCCGETLKRLRSLLMPRATIATPNRAEARALVPEADDERAAAHALLSEGCRHVLVTGASETADTLTHRLFSRAGGAVKESELVCPKLAGRFHGGGCTLAAAIAAKLARGLEAGQAVQEAQDWTLDALKGAENPNRTQRFPNRRR